MSSFDNGWSAGAVARLSKPATISRATPTTIFVPRFKFDFIAEYPLLLALPNPTEASLILSIESFLPVKVVWPARLKGWEPAVILTRRLYTEELAAAMEVSPGAGGGHRFGGVTEFHPAVKSPQ